MPYSNPAAVAARSTHPLTMRMYITVIVTAVGLLIVSATLAPFVD